MARGSLRRTVRIEEYWPERQIRDLYRPRDRKDGRGDGTGPPTGPSADASPVDDRRVLLAEEDRATAELVRHRVEREGGIIERVLSGPSALETWIEDRFDLAIVQARMPGLLAAEFLRTVGTKTAPSPPVMVIGWPGNDQEVVQALDLGAADYLVKPFSPAILMARVRRILRTGSGSTDA